MTKLEFLKGMKKLANLYLKDMKDDELTTWYEVFSSGDVTIFYMAIHSIGTKNKYFPVCAELVEEYKNQMPIHLHKVLENNKSVPKDRMKYLQDMNDWYSLQKEYPKELLDEIFEYRKAITNKTDSMLLGYKE